MCKDKGYGLAGASEFLLRSPLFKGIGFRVTKTILFICTGNFYRSRFAEAVFNYTADQRALDWRAVSRGLAIHWAEGAISPYTASALALRRIPLRYTGPGRVQLSEVDLDTAARRIALDRQEHWAMMEEQFPKWVHRIEYWDVADLPLSTPEVALPSIEAKVQSLLEELASEQSRIARRS